MNDLAGMDQTMNKLSTLNETDRTMLGLYYYEDLTTAEIAAVLEMDHAQVEDSLNEILTRMESDTKTQTSTQSENTTSVSSL